MTKVCSLAKFTHKIDHQINWVEWVGGTGLAHGLRVLEAGLIVQGGFIILFCLLCTSACLYFTTAYNKKVLILKILRNSLLYIWYFSFWIFSSTHSYIAKIMLKLLYLTSFIVLCHQQPHVSLKILPKYQTKSLGAQALTPHKPGSNPGSAVHCWVTLT